MPAVLLTTSRVHLHRFLKRSLIELFLNEFIVSIACFKASSTQHDRFGPFRAKSTIEQGML